MWYLPEILFWTCFSVYVVVVGYALYTMIKTVLWVRKENREHEKWFNEKFGYKDQDRDRR